MEKALAVSTAEGHKYITVGSMSTKMGRPQTINSGGEIRRLGLVLAEPVALKLEQKAKKRGVSMSQIIREALEQVA